LPDGHKTGGDHAELHTVSPGDFLTSGGSRRPPSGARLYSK